MTLSILGSVIALVLACALFVGYDVVTSREAMARRLTSESEIIGTNSASALLFQDQEAARRTLEALRAERRIVAAIIYTKEGKAFAAYWRDTPSTSAVLRDLPPRPEFDYRFTSDRLVLLQPIDFDGDTIGSVSLESEVVEVTERAWRYLGIALVVLTVSSGVAAPRFSSKAGRGRERASPSVSRGSAMPSHPPESRTVVCPMTSWSTPTLSASEREELRRAAVASAGPVTPEVDTDPTPAMDRTSRFRGGLVLPD